MLQTATPASHAPASHQFPAVNAGQVMQAKDFPGSNTYMTKHCGGCCPYLPHKGMFGDLNCRECGNTGHKPGCQAR